MVATNTGTRTVIALVENKAGVLARICGLFRRQGFNIASLAVGRSEIEGLSRMTFVVEGPEEVVSHWFSMTCEVERVKGIEPFGSSTVRSIDSAVF